MKLQQKQQKGVSYIKQRDKQTKKQLNIALMTGNERMDGVIKRRTFSEFNVRNSSASDQIYLMEQLIKREQFAQEQQSDSDQDVKIHRQGMWNEEQLQKFMIFTYFNKQIMCSKLQRRTLKIFKQMARFITTRNSIQCRSQNQKLIKKYKSINRILKIFLDKVGSEYFNKLCLSHSKDPQVKYIINQQPPKQKAGHAVSISTQTDFPSDSDSEQPPNQGKIQQKNDLIYPFNGDVARYQYYYGM